MNKQHLTKLINGARRERNSLKLLALQSVLAAIQTKENTDNTVLSDQEILKIVEKEKRLYEESLEAFKVRYKKDDPELIQKIKELETLLPKKIDESIYQDIADKYIEDLNVKSIKQMGLLIKTVKEAYGVSIDFGKFSQIVKNKLT